MFVNLLGAALDERGYTVSKMNNYHPNIIHAIEKCWYLNASAR